MTENEIIEAVRASFGGLVDEARRAGEYVLVTRTSAAMAIPVTSDHEDETIAQRIENSKDCFINGLSGVK